MDQRETLGMLVHMATTQLARHWEGQADAVKRTCAVYKKGRKALAAGARSSGYRQSGITDMEALAQAEIEFLVKSGLIAEIRDVLVDIAALERCRFRYPSECLC